MNKKHGTGCTLLTYNLCRLFNLPIFVDKDSFMLDDEHKLLFPQVSKITAGAKRGIFDIGSNFETRYAKKFINNAKLIIIPFEYGYECMVSTIQTLKYIEYATARRIPIVLVLNRLDRTDQDRDFNYTNHMKDKFREEGIDFGNIFNHNQNNIYLTYLRNSYSVQSNLESGEYFLDKQYNHTYISDKLNYQSEFRTGVNFFEYRFFLNITKEIISEVDYRNEDIYEQDKDMVQFRNNYSEYISINYGDIHHSLNNDLHNFIMRNTNYDDRIYVEKLINRTYIAKEKKLLKDMAYIGFLIDVIYYDKSF